MKFFTIVAAIVVGCVAYKECNDLSHIQVGWGSTHSVPSSQSSK